MVCGDGSLGVRHGNMGRRMLLTMAWLFLLTAVVPCEEPPLIQHWQMTMGEVYRVNSFFCISKQGIDKLIEARMNHHEAPFLAFRFPEECKLGKFAFRPLEITNIEKSYYLAQRDDESAIDCTNSQGKVYKCAFIQFTSRYVFGQLLMPRQTLEVFVEAPPSITVSDS